MENNPLLQAESLALSQLNPLLAQIDLFALADVTNPYFGNQGFAQVLVRKGASQETIQQLDQQASAWLSTSSGPRGSIWKSLVLVRQVGLVVLFVWQVVNWFLDLRRSLH